tara:strand:+ start:131 stop:427 length:297 start_codon:yes stop_codon:yes gene_type:complete
MKLTEKTLMKLVEEVLNEQPPNQQQQSKEKEEPQEKPLKTDIPNSPFEPDVSQVKDELKKILKTWQTKEYQSDEIRWKLYYKDILNLFKKLEAEETGE